MSTRPSSPMSAGCARSLAGTPRCPSVCPSVVASPSSGRRRCGLRPKVVTTSRPTTSRTSRTRSCATVSCSPTRPSSPGSRSPGLSTSSSRTWPRPPTDSPDAVTTPTTPESPAASPDGRAQRLMGRHSSRHAGEGRPLADRVRSYAATAGDTLVEWRRLAQPVLGPVAAVLGCVSPLGWLVAAAALGSWFVGWTLGWQEFMYAAAAMLVLLALSSLLTIGRMSLEVRTRLEPQRVTAGDGAAVEVWVRNTGRAPLLPLPLDMPTDQTVTRFNLPALGSGSEFEDVVVMPTERCGVFGGLTATAERGDPLGPLRRDVTRTEAARSSG